MVGEDPEADEPAAERLQGPPEPSGLPIPQKAATRPAGQLVERTSDLPSASIRSSGACRDSTQRSGPARRSASRRIAGARRLVDQVGPREDDHAGPPQRADRLAEQPAGEEPAQAERVEGVEQDEVEVARQPAMLEAVVEDEQLGLQLLDGDRAPGDPVRVLEVGDVGQVLLQHPPLVVEPAGLAVAPAEDRDADAPAGGTTARPTRPSASCRSRRA